MSSKTRILTVGLALLSLCTMLFYVQGVLIPFQEKDAANQDRPRGNLSDLYPRWLGARELLLNGRDPYGPEVTREIQAGYYGRPLEAGRSGEPKDQNAFAYPVYVVFLLAPTVTLPFSIVQTAFSGLLFLITLASVPLWLVFLRWRPQNSTIIAITLLTVGCFPVIQGLKLQQLSLLVSGLIALSVALLSRRHLFSAGVLMAFASIKPQLTVPISGWLLLWALFDWHSRRRYVLGFAVTMGAFLAGSEWLLPGWLARFRDAITAYRNYTGSQSLLDVLVTPTWARLLEAVLVIVVIVVCWRARKVSESQPEFVWITSLVLTVTVVIVPMIAPYNQVMLLPGILLLSQQRAQLWNKGLLSRTMVFASCLVIFWQWIGSTTVAIGSAFASADTVQEWWAAPLYSMLFVPLPVLALQLMSGPSKLGASIRP
jgi:glycosyl transferase family 87